MLVHTKAKRQRHPNVRLGEVGEISAAFSCGVLRKSKVNPEGNKRQKLGDKNDGEVHLNPTCEVSSQLFEFASSDSIETQKRENQSPHSRLGFRASAPEVRVTKRGRSVRCSSGVMGSSWHSGVTSGINNNGNWKLSGDDESEVAVSKVHANLCAADGSQECFDPETSDTRPLGKEWEETSADEGCCAAVVEGGMGQTSFGGTVVNNIRGWLDDLGFGKYGDVFEVHEVDGEVLPLLTFEDLKEMGINAIGSRRKIFNAIQLLQDGVSV